MRGVREYADVRMCASSAKPQAQPGCKKAREDGCAQVDEIVGHHAQPPHQFGRRAAAVKALRGLKYTHISLAKKPASSTPSSPVAPAG